jgi:hypothetical protein
MKLLPAPVVAQAYESTRRVATHRAWLGPIARAGYVSKGVLYLTIGVLALLVAFGEGGVLTDERGALDHLAGNDFGFVLVALTGIGLVAHTLWQLVRAVFDPERPASTDAKGIARRLSYAVSALVHGGLAVAAFLVLTTGAPGEDGGHEWARELTSNELGFVVLAIVGVVLVCFGGHQLLQAKNVDFRDELDVARMNDRAWRWTERAGRFGYAARGVVFIVTGGSLLVASVSNDPNDAKGIGGVLEAIAAAPLGETMLAVVAFGLAVYGLFMFVYARYRRIPG